MLVTLWIGGGIWREMQAGSRFSACGIILPQIIARPAIGKMFALNAHRRMDVVKELGRLRMLKVDEEPARHH
jgi:hypothetical protein